MEHLNKVELRGIVGTVRIQSAGDRKFAKMTVATNLAYLDKEGCPVIETTWHNVTAWEGKTIQDLEKLEKGANVEITGRLKNQRYTSPDGETRCITEILANRLKLIDEPLTMQEQ